MTMSFTKKISGIKALLYYGCYIAFPARFRRRVRPSTRIILPSTMTLMYVTVLCCHSRIHLPDTVRIVLTLTPPRPALTGHPSVITRGKQHNCHTSARYFPLKLLTRIAFSPSPAHWFPGVSVLTFSVAEQRKHHCMCLDFNPGRRPFRNAEVTG